MGRREEDRVQTLVLRIFQLEDLLKDAANRITRPAGQTGARWQVLNALDDRPRTAAEIARLKRATRQGVQRIVNELLKEDIVVAAPNPKHRRFPLLQLTARGRAALQNIQRQRQLWANDVLSHLEGGVEDAALRFLDRFQAAVEKSKPMTTCDD